ncbi:MAG TPA: response regulator transcription factor [Ohtaekwangia sp.]
MISVFIVDDHSMVVEGIRSLLAQDNSITFAGHAASAADCLEQLIQEVPDVILMDINLPDKSGIELCKEVKKLYPQVYILGLSTFNQQSFINSMMDFGASGYLVKNASQEELLEAIHTVVKGVKYLSEDAAAMVRSKSDHNTLPVITRREKEVLVLIAEGLTNAEIADKLFISVTTVDSHRKNLLAKFNTRNTASLVRLAMLDQLI